MQVKILDLDSGPYSGIWRSLDFRHSPDQVRQMCHDLERTDSSWDNLINIDFLHIEPFKFFVIWIIKNIQKSNDFPFCNTVSELSVSFVDIRNDNIITNYVP